MDKATRIFVAGHRGLAGGAVRAELERQGYRNLLLRTHAELDLEDAAATRRFFDSERPELVYLCAAKVGGILANSRQPVDFLQRNLAIQASVLQVAFATGVRRLVFLGSSCIYPRDCPQPIREDYFLTGPLEMTNRAYAIAKIAGVETCWAYNRQHGTRWLAAMPTNLYGPGDSYDPENSHVLPALIRKVHEAKVAGRGEVVLWGTGRPLREFLYAGDLARALVFLGALDDPRLAALTAPDVCPLINIGTGGDQTILAIAELVARVLGYRGRFVHDLAKPDGTPRKLLDVSRIKALGWAPQVSLEEGIALAYQDFVARHASPG